MKNRMLGIGGIMGFCLLVTAGCMNKVPNFSFQQALEVATQDQSKAVEILQFLNTKEHQLLSHLKLQASIEGDSVLEGKIELQNENASDMAHNMAQSDLSLSFAGTVNKTSKETGEELGVQLKLNTLLRDNQALLRVNDLEVQAGEQNMVGIFTSMIKTIKGQWFKWDFPGFELIMQQPSSSKRVFAKEILAFLQNEKNYTGVMETQYEGSQAWKFDLNTEKLKNLLIKFYNDNLNKGEDFQMSGSGIENKLFLQEILATLTIENTEAYLVVRSADKVDWIIKNMDINMGESMIKLTHLVDGKTAKLTLLLQASAEKEASLVTLTLKQTGKGKYHFDLQVAQEQSQNIPLLSLKGKLKINTLSSEKIAIEPEFEFDTALVKGKLNAQFSAEATKDFNFLAPKAEEIQSLSSLTQMFGLPELGNHQETGATLGDSVHQE